MLSSGKARSIQKISALYGLSSSRTYSQIVSPLSYDLHEPHESQPNGSSPIVFLHGLFGSKKNNRAISKVLARDLKRSVYALDLRNHGSSPHHERHTYVDMAADVAGFVEKLDTDPVTIIGHSMGAKTAMTLALTSPDLVKDIIAVDNAPADVALNRSFAEYIRGMRKVDEAGVSRQVEADRIMSEFEPSLPIRQFLLGNLYRPEGQQTQRFKIPLQILARSLDHMGDFPFKDPGSARFEKPVLFIRGTQSKYVPDDVLPLIGQFFPRFQLCDIDAGHWLISEQPEAFRRAVVQFLSPLD